MPPATPSFSSRPSAIGRADDDCRTVSQADLPAGILNVVNGDKDAVDAILDDPDIKAIGLSDNPVRTTSVPAAAPATKRVQCFGGARYAVHHARRRHGSGSRCID
ncbi:MAG: hypothetical protein R3D29_09225 [Nitratireductor sp.]